MPARRRYPHSGSPHSTRLQSPAARCSMNGPAVLQTTFAPVNTLRQLFNRPLRFHHFIFRSFDAWARASSPLQTRPAPSRGDKRHVVLAQKFRNEPPRKSVGAINHNRIFIAHSNCFASAAPRMCISQLTGQTSFQAASDSGILWGPRAYSRQKYLFG